MGTNDSSLIRLGHHRRIAYCKRTRNKVITNKNNRKVNFSNDSVLIMSKSVGGVCGILRKKTSRLSD